MFSIVYVVFDGQPFSRDYHLALTFHLRIELDT